MSRAAERILIVAPQPFYEDRGTPIAVRQLVEALAELGYAVDLLTFPIGKEVDAPGLRILRTANPLRFTEIPIGFSTRKLVLDGALTLSLWRQLRRERYACIHAVEEAIYPALVLGRRLGVPVVYDMQSSLPEQLRKHRLLRGSLVQRALRRAERWALQRADIVIGSAGLTRRVARVYPATRFREWRFPSAFAQGSDAEALAIRAELGIPAEAPVVLYTGTFEEYQGLPELVAALPMVTAAVPDAFVVLVGARPSQAGELLDTAGPAVPAERLRIVGRQPRDRMPHFLAMADVLVSPRLYGGNLPLKIFDYMAAERPIVATDIPTHRSVLAEDRAVLVAPRSEALAEAIVGLLRDPARGRALAVAARAYAESHFGWARFTDTVDELFREALANGR